MPWFFTVKTDAMIASVISFSCGLYFFKPTFVKTILLKLPGFTPINLWFVFKSGLYSRVGYHGTQTVFIIQKHIFQLQYLLSEQDVISEQGGEKIPFST